MMAMLRQMQDSRSRSATTSACAGRQLQPYKYDYITCTLRVPFIRSRYREMYNGTLMAAGGFTPVSAAQAISEGYYDLIAFGRW